MAQHQPDMIGRRLVEALGAKNGAAVLESVVLRNRRGVDQMHGITVIHQAIDQPVPAVGGLHRHADQLVPVRRKVTEQAR
ncbi:hypothetical protein RHOFW104T7_16110 [Rhodanobacter thiooxydans]|uniref:Uncharacterized protein n=1 Tax=Rhodanobacter thiooxydans TaxID=416169 RepID=A0A154QF96_9GAMM|nr:hypothetical protein RHOFW104T7_16110 [Rhodanobacter thiooxydans]